MQRELVGQLQEALLAREAAEAVQDTVCTGHA
jgi:hypothetical protein